MIGRRRFFSYFWGFKVVLGGVWYLGKGIGELVSRYSSIIVFDKVFVGFRMYGVG